MIPGRLRKLAAGAAGLSLLVVGAGSVASAAPATSAPTSLTVRRVDATASPTIHVDVALTGAVPAAESFGVKVNGSAVQGVRAVPLAQSKTPTATVLLVDTGSTMNTGAAMDHVRAGLRALIAAKAANAYMGVVAYGGSPRVVLPLTQDPAAITGAVDRLAIGGTSSLWAGVRMAATVLGTQSNTLPQMLVVGDSSNVGTLATASDADGDLLASQALTDVVGIHFGTSTADLGDLRALASAGGGRYYDAPDAPTFTAAMANAQQDLTNQFELTFVAPTSVASTLVVTTGHLSATAQAFPGGVAVGSAVNPPSRSPRQVPGPLRGKFGLLVIAVLVLAAVGLLAYAVSLLVTREESGLTHALRPYAERGTTTDADDEEDRGFAQSALMQRAVETTARLAKERGVLDKVETRLEQADLALRPAEAILFYLIGAALLTVLAGVLLGPILGLLVLVLAVVFPPAILNYLASARLKKFNTELPDTLQLLASSLKAGFSFLQGVEAVAQEVADPMGAELRRVIVEARLGRSVEESLEECAARMQSPDFDWAVMAVNIQREVGGNLADLLQTVSVTMVERERLRRDVKSLTAEGRMSAIVLGILPPGLGLVFYVTNPKYINVLFTHIGGQIALGVAVVAMLVGFAWMKKIVDIKV